MISNISQVLLFFTIMIINEGESYTDYTYSFVLASCFSSFIYYVSAKKCF